MRNLLKKLHMMPNQSEDGGGDASTSIKGSSSSSNSKWNGGSTEKVSLLSNSEQKQFSGLSGWLSSVANRHSPSPPNSSKRGEKTMETVSDPPSFSGLEAVLDTVRQESESSNSRDPEVEEEFQIQLALEMSAREDPEAVQIEAVKQISLGSCPAQNTPAEVLAFRYWSYNSLSYDDKILDGFYDLYGILAESTSEKMPSLVDLQGTPVSNNISWEAVLVNRSADANLIELEQRALMMTVESRAATLGFVDRGLVQDLATLVSDYMGGAVGNPESMLKAWRDLSVSLRATLNSMVLPLGYLTIGLARHRALLFKVLADSVGIPCWLMKGRQHTGSDDVAMNIVKMDDRRDYIVDLMAAPGTLIPFEAASDTSGPREFQEPFFMTTPYPRDVDQSYIASSSSGVVSSIEVCSDFEKSDKLSKFKDPTTERTDNLSTKMEHTDPETPKVESPHDCSTDPDKCEVESKLSEDRFTVEKALVRELPGRPTHPYTHARSPSWTEGVSSPAVRRMKVKDVSQYMIDAAKENPDLAQKLHDVLLESGVVAPANLFSEIYAGQREASLIGAKNKIEDEVDKKRENTSRRKDESELGSGHEPRGSGDREPAVRLEAEKSLDKSTGNGSTSSDVVLDDDVAEWEIPWDEITLGERIGLGSYGEVYRGDWHGTEVAVKKFLDQDISGDALEEFRSEVRIMKRLRHPNVVLFMGAITRAPNLSIVTEFLPRGSLYRLIHRPNSQIDERRRLRMALDVARGMNYLHNCTPVIVHRDLKSPNLLVDKNWVVKVCDFGLSRMKHNTFLSSRSTAGTAEWMAPEVLRNEPSDEKSDVYSFGVILWELLTLQQPWGGMNPMQVVGAVGFQHRRLDVPADLDPIVSDIIIRCWQTDPRLRPSFTEIMAALRPLQKPISNAQVPRPRGPPRGSEDNRNY